MVALQPGDVHSRTSDDPQFAGRDAAPRVKEDIKPLVRSQQAEEQDDRPLHRT